jgi:hypothetical protein
MKKQLMITTAFAAMLALGACATQPAAPAKPKTMSAAELSKAFAKGSKVCAFTSADGKTKGEDFYYKNQTATSGDLDRNIGAKTIQGSWKILGPGFWMKLGTGKKVKGKWMNLAKTGKKSFDAYDSSGKKVMSMKCK